MDPLAGSSWSAPGTVTGFSQSPPNDVLLRFAAQEHARIGGGRLIDIGCGAGRNAVPLAELGWDVTALDLSWPMLEAAAARARDVQDRGRLRLVLAPMHHLPLRDDSAHLLVAHGIWNLAPSAAVFRTAVAEAARVARPGAALFVFTFSRHTLADDAAPVPGEPFVFTEFSGQPQCFLTEQQLLEELGAAGFAQEPGRPLVEYNRPKPGTLTAGRTPVIWEGVFRRCG
jgi:ubiquinone/menaquinone biosynthesis C-methylase UbiE